MLAPYANENRYFRSVVIGVAPRRAGGDRCNRSKTNTGDVKLARFPVTIAREAEVLTLRSGKRVRVLWLIADDSLSMLLPMKNKQSIPEEFELASGR
jgi:hypothetical protein